jgi:hypothetical protein
VFVIRPRPLPKSRLLFLEDQQRRRIGQRFLLALVVAFEVFVLALEIMYLFLDAFRLGLFFPDVKRRLRNAFLFGNLRDTLVVGGGKHLLENGFLSLCGIWHIYLVVALSSQL